MGSSVRLYVCVCVCEREGERERAGAIVYCILGNIVRKANKGLNIIILERCIRDKRGDRHQKIKERLQHIDKMKALIHFVWGGGAAGGRGATA